ncbi:PaaI family thioesterase [Acidisoma cladoniae]|jgi:uncharacterized protein (TIGR00369 family)|uniref:PaaI family thioesterase n=1 Tax=Acidisoma cladoniae TaxID=3040935 RepID=UPI00254C6F3C|nr:PaaI family thioesterase [Acidisoma sp. PAMC 29798]
MNAIKRLQAMRDGRAPLPPLYDTLGLSVTSATSGIVGLALRPSERLGNPYGKVGGGALATALDTAAAWACDTVCGADKICTTVEFKTNFLRPVLPHDDILNVIAAVIQCGSRIMVAEARMSTAGGDLVAIAIVTCLVIDRPGAPHFPHDPHHEARTRDERAQ